MRIGVVVPCYNEERRLDVPAFAQFLGSTALDVRLLFVDDGSTDGTAHRIASIIDLAPERASILRLERNCGKAEAVRQGMNRLAAQNEDVVGFWDADLATPLEAMTALAHVLDRRPDVEWVFGARVALLGRHIERKPLRHYLGRVFATLAAVTLSLKVYDTQCGAKLFRASPALQLVLAEPFISRWIFEIEMIARLGASQHSHGLRAHDCIYEMPLLAWRDIRGSKVKPTDFFRATLELARIRLRYGAKGRVVPALALT